MLPAPLRADPRLPGYEFFTVAGTVLSETVIPRTPSAQPPPGVHPNALRYRELWVRQENGKEVKLFADADQIHLREGHRVTLIVAEGSDGAHHVAQVWNHDAPHCSTVVESTVRHVAHDFKGRTGCVTLPVTAVWAGIIVGAVAEYSLGIIAGVLATGLAFMVPISVWLRRLKRDDLRFQARKAAMVEHLAAIAAALSLPAAEPGGGSTAERA